MKQTIQLLSLLLCCLTIQANGQEYSAPKIGLTLSGGGAKGLAHIGILQALDSAGVHVDYVTGTSMGSIVGSLYAIGYSGKEIEQIARNLDWNQLLSNQVSLRSISMEEKEAYGKYAVEIPFERGKFRIPTGALESQELWLKLSEVYFPAFSTKDFNNFKRPFRAVATDVETGDPIVLDQGELITAIRASMAIPGVFTAVEMHGRRLVDGGVVRNLPVTEARDMGADFVIASNVSEGMRLKENLTNPIQILTQIAFFRESEDHRRQVAMSDLYINHPLEPFSTGSFDKVQAIIDSGIVLGKRLYPTFTRLVDSLQAASAPPHGSVQTQMDRPDSVFIVAAKVEGLDSETKRAFLKGLEFKERQWYSPTQISALIRRRFGNLNYDRIRYRLIPETTREAHIVFEVKESPATKAKLNIHYNSFTGLSLIANMTTRNVVPNSRSFATLNLGDNSRIRLEHLQYLGRPRKTAFVSRLQSERFNVTRYADFKGNGLYRLQNFKWDNSLQSGSNRSHTYGIGTRFERIQFTPSIQSAFEVEGTNQFFTSYAHLSINTLDKNDYPKSGIHVFAETGRIFAQHHDLTFYSDGQVITPDERFVPKEDNFTQGYLQAAWYRPLSTRLTLSGLIQAGFTLGLRQNLFNAFNIGGLNRMYRNQIVFPGLPDFSAYANNLVALQIGLRRELSNNFYLTARSNLLYHDFIKPGTDTLIKRAITGHSLTLAYNSLFGPIEFSAMYSEKVKALETYVNVGFSF